MSAEQISIALLDAQAVNFNLDCPYRWTSGYSMPVYTDMRCLIGNSQFRKLIYQSILTHIRERKLHPEWIAGAALGGIPYATGVADLLSLPLCFVRASQKKHGRQRQVEGLPATTSLSQASVLLIEDVVSTGGSLLNSLHALCEVEAKVDACLTIFDYGFPSKVRSACKMFISLLNFDTLLSMAGLRKVITEAEADALSVWANDPFGWGKAHGFD